MFKIIKIKKGYTVIELIITLVIILTIFIIVEPMLKINRCNLKIFSAKLCQEIRNIRIINMTEDSLYYIVIKKDRYFVKRGIATLKTEYLDSNLILLDNFDDGALDYSIIHFNHNGMPSYAGTVRIKDINTGKYMEITIIPVTGRVLLKGEIFK
ncbi:hypothetical protein [Caminicella sporogenes]|uniref:hypothetical protein n=1 Tax=Caminicella sporogenes TaxID=166485 RepID=UPI0025401AE8|nr:hypothetical protein [Caminicella sporogenes]WIF94522.1 hypothetical protein QNI18_09665 [Caminicella sporogenes]